GEPIGQCKLIGGCERRYSAADIEACLPAPLPPKAAASTRQLAATPNRQSSDGWPPRTVTEIKAAAAYIPARIVGAGTYEESMHALCGCSAAFAEAGVADGDGAALALLGHLWADAAPGAARQVLTSTTTRNAASYWKIAGDNGFPLSRKQSGTIREQSQNIPDSAAKPKQLTFEERWELLELHAAELAISNWPAMKALSSLASRAASLDIHRLSQRQLEQLLEQAQRQIRAKSAPISPGGKFTVTSTPFAVAGLFRHALNLLVGQSGAGKSRLIAACMAAWLRGDKTWLKRNLNGIEAENRHALIIGPDQNLEDWHLTLAPVGLSWLANSNDSTTVQIHDRLTLYGLETGIQLDADGLNTIRRWVDAHPGGMVLIDSLSACLPAGVDEDKSGAAAPIHKLNEALGDAWGVLTHHTRKSAGKEGNLGVGAGRGSGAIDAAVSRVIGLGLTYKMENGMMVAQESDPRRELLSTKRGGKTEHLIISSDASGFWDVHGDAEALKAQERIERTISNLTEPQSDVLSAVEAADGWITTRGIVEALVPGDEYEPKGGKAAATRTVLKRLEVLGLIESQRVANERNYRIKEKQSYQAVNKGELVLTQEFELTSSLSSPVGMTGESLVHQLVHRDSPASSLVHPLVSLEKQAPTSEKLVIAAGELGEQLEVIGELPSELVKTPAPQQVNKVNYLDSSASSPASSLSSPTGMTKRAEAEQRIKACGQTTINLTGLSDAEMVGMADSLEAAFARSVGRATAA
ncbi:AAA family ATPase, partial [Synechococcus sp. Cruz CV12-2-Slac-r]|uniref:AAA family ATPase n=1 Tax=Synechococcus sp. Cruz CV12-2-Slac-r TaxID=2823748 RepID=UPI0020CE5DB5